MPTDSNPYLTESAFVKHLPRLNVSEELLPWAHRLVNDLFLQLVQIADAINALGGGGGGGPTHNLLSLTHPDTPPGTPARGDSVVAAATPTWTCLPIPAIGRFLRSTGSDPVWSAIGRGDLPIQIAYEDEANIFLLAQEFRSYLSIVSSSTPADPPAGTVYMYQNKTGSTVEVRIRFEDGTECVVCTQTIAAVGDELPLNWVE